MADRGDYDLTDDPTDRGLWSDADREALQRRRRPRRRRTPPPEEPPRSIGPVAPSPGCSAERRRAHMSRIYADRNWERERLTPEEERAKEERRRRRELQRRG